MDVSTFDDDDEVQAWSGPGAQPARLPWHAAVPVIGLGAAALWSSLWLLAQHLLT